MTDYITIHDLKKDNPEAGLNDSGDYDVALQRFITDASRLIDREIGKWDDYFYPSTDAEVRYFDGNGHGTLYIDDLVSISELAVSDEGGRASSDYTVWSSSDYILHPYNTTPKYKIIVDRLNGSKLYFDPYYMAVRVTGVFGYSTTPPQVIKRACSIQALRWFQRAKQQWADTGAKSDFGQVVVNVNNKDFVGSKLDPDVAALLQPFKVAAMGDE